eukprot:TRINITY_DN38764_c0_g1_i1.p1 TRINITY_DN38764_c0_g1~~TRINITY_DN38764_c0_g1_i1.p1  ORF type:complete len:446 (-),score=54.93 TRINITY_DN38764_c0_g1_i1:668-2005(-)
MFRCDVFIALLIGAIAVLSGLFDVRSILKLDSTNFSVLSSVTNINISETVLAPLADINFTDLLTLGPVKRYNFTELLYLSPIARVDFTPSNFSALPPPEEGGLADAVNKLADAELRFRNEIFGPESIAFDPLGGGPYTGIADGRVVQWTGEAGGWITFATTSPNRTEACTLEIPGPNLPMEHICGRPLGLRFHQTTGDLYIADAYYGLLKVGKEGGLAKSVVTEAEGVPFGFTNDLDIDEEEETIYFTDTSTKYQRRQFLLEILEGNGYGRLLKYSARTGKTEVLLSGLAFPNGVALSKDKDYLLFCETSLFKVHKYWLKGEKAGKSEELAVMPGWNDNIRLNPRGRFWVGVHSRRSRAFNWASSRPGVRKSFLSLPISSKIVYLAGVGLPSGIILELDGETGNVTQILEDPRGKVVKAVSEVEEHNGELWMGSVIMPHIAVLKT